MPVAPTKGQLISKRYSRAVTSPKKGTKLIILSIFSSQDSEFGRNYGSTVAFLEVVKVT